NGYCRRIFQEMSTWNCGRDLDRNLRAYKEWIEFLIRNPREVFVGPDLTYGGVRGHVRAIKEFSALKIQLVPDESAMGELGNFSPEIVQRFMEFTPVGQPVVHSHVVPWMIKWCSKQQAHGSPWIHTYHLNYFPEHGKNALELWQIQINESLVTEA